MLAIKIQWKIEKKTVGKQVIPQIRQVQNVYTMQYHNEDI